MPTRRPDRPGERPRPRSEAAARPARPVDGDLLSGRNAVYEALRGRRRPRRLFFAEGIRDDDRVRRLRTLANERGIPVETLPRLELDRRTAGANHQGVALDATSYPYVAFDRLVESAGTILVLDHLQDPQNLGSLFRAAEATGVAGVVLPKDRAAEVTPAVVNASAGAVEHLAVCQVPNLTRALESLKRAGWWAAALDLGPDAVDLFRADLPSPLALVVGAEGTGIAPLVRRSCDLVLSLPMVGKVASLNAATAGAVALFEIVRRGRPGPDGGQARD